MARTGSAALAIDTGASMISTPAAALHLVGGPEEQHAHALLGGERGGGRDFSGPEVGAVGVDRYDCTVPGGRDH